MGLKEGTVVNQGEIQLLWLFIGFFSALFGIAVVIKVLVKRVRRTALVRIQISNCLSD